MCLNKKSSLKAALQIISNKFYTELLPRISDIINSTINIKNNTLAMPAALEAIPPNPNIAAIIATTKKITVQRNIIISLSD